MTPAEIDAQNTPRLLRKVAEVIVEEKAPMTVSVSGDDILLSFIDGTDTGIRIKRDHHSPRLTWTDAEGKHRVEELSAPTDVALSLTALDAALRDALGNLDVMPVEKTALGPHAVPLLTVGIRLGMPDGSGRAFFKAHRDRLNSDHGAEVIDDLERAMNGDFDAAMRFAKALVPDATFTLREDGRRGRSVVYMLASQGVAGRTSTTSTEKKAEALTIVAAAINLWEASTRFERRQDLAGNDGVDTEDDLPHP